MSANVDIRNGFITRIIGFGVLILLIGVGDRANAADKSCAEFEGLWANLIDSMVSVDKETFAAYRKNINTYAGYLEAVLKDRKKMCDVEDPLVILLNSLIKHHDGKITDKKLTEILTDPILPVETIWVVGSVAGANDVVEDLWHQEVGTNILFWLIQFGIDGVGRDVVRTRFVIRLMPSADGVAAQELWDQMWALARNDPMRILRAKELFVTPAFIRRFTGGPTDVDPKDFEEVTRSLENLSKQSADKEIRERASELRRLLLTPYPKKAEG